MITSKYILPLGTVGMDNHADVGGKNASLGQMLQHLAPLGINIPPVLLLRWPHIKIHRAQLAG